MESEFFGHSAGAFTGAQKARLGLLREADGGSLLLDEIGEMPLALQAKLLRVLQEGRMRNGDDVLLLSDYFLEQLKQQQPKSIRGFSTATQRCLQSYRFPGNVRELQNAIEQAYTFCAGALIEPEHLPARLRNTSDTDAPNSQPEWPTLQQLQDNYVQQVMAYCQGNKQRAAKLLGVTRRTLYRWLTSAE